MLKDNVRVFFLRDNTHYNDQYTGPEGTLTMDTQRKRPRLHDGNTKGGIELAATIDLKDFLSTSDVVNNLTSTVIDAPLSAEQGRVLKSLIDDINSILQADDTSLDELQEIIDYIKANRDDLANLDITNIAGLPSALNDKVDKVSGKALSDNNFTDGWKNKLNGIEANAERNVGTDLGLTGSGNNRTVTSSTGSNVALPTATPSNAGLMATGDKAKLNAVEANAERNVPTNLGLSGSGNNRTITSSTGSNVAVPIATPSNAGFISSQDKAKLNGIETGAEKNPATTASRSLSSTTTVLQAKGMDDHRKSGDHDGRYYTKSQVDSRVDDAGTVTGQVVSGGLGFNAPGYVELKGQRLNAADYPNAAAAFPTFEFSGTNAVGADLFFGITGYTIVGGNQYGKFVILEMEDNSLGASYTIKTVFAIYDIITKRQIHKTRGHLSNATPWPAFSVSHDGNYIVTLDKSSVGTGYRLDEIVVVRVNDGAVMSRIFELGGTDYRSHIRRPQFYIPPDQSYLMTVIDKTQVFTTNFPNASPSSVKNIGNIYEAFPVLGYPVDYRLDRAELYPSPDGHFLGFWVDGPNRFHVLYSNPALSGDNHLQAFADAYPAVSGFSTSYSSAINWSPDSKICTFLRRIPINGKKVHVGTFHRRRTDNTFVFDRELTERYASRIPYGQRTVAKFLSNNLLLLDPGEFPGDVLDLDKDIILQTGRTPGNEGLDIIPAVGYWQGSSGGGIIGGDVSSLVDYPYMAFRSSMNDSLIHIVEKKAPTEVFLPRITLGVGEYPTVLPQLRWFVKA